MPFLKEIARLAKGMDRFDIIEELKKIRARDADVSSSTLLKTDTLRVVLMALKAGARLHEHHADGRLLLQVLQGEIDFEAENAKQTLKAGMLVSVDAMALHAVSASSAAALLLTIAWPQPDSSKTDTHRNVGYK